jgi:hypothetical protein
MKPMETRFKSTIRAARHSCGVVCAVAIVLQLGVLAGYAQTGTYLFTGSETTITLNPGTYTITAYGAQGGSSYIGPGGLGAQMSAEFSFSALTTLTLLVGGGGEGFYGGAGGGAGGSFVVNGSTPLVIAGGGGGRGYISSPADTGLTGTSGGAGHSAYQLVPGGTNGYGGSARPFGGGGGGYYGDGATSFGYAGGGGSSFLNGGNGGYGGSDGYGGDLGGAGGFGGGGGGGNTGGGGGGGYSGGGGGDSYESGGGGGSYIDSSAAAVLTEIAGIASPDGSPNGEIIVTAIPEPTTLALAGLSGLCLLLLRRQQR